ncbi:hypothetical protein Cgig2_033625 [Carnegiea gigantea]|uniref:Uncharacterized protein n=1 Tax=Carnegiea gigantea TaxID=171969 RepID=A0A9Q1K266_9CARY|nr:hypothetical protein Cgig2_033625 [Carnegiea gigantea]
MYISTCHFSLHSEQHEAILSSCWRAIYVYIYPHVTSLSTQSSTRRFWAPVGGHGPGRKEGEAQIHSGQLTDDATVVKELPELGFTKGSSSLVPSSPAKEQQITTSVHSTQTRFTATGPSPMCVDQPPILPATRATNLLACVHGSQTLVASAETGLMQFDLLPKTAESVPQTKTPSPLPAPKNRIHSRPEDRTAATSTQPSPETHLTPVARMPSSYVHTPIARMPSPKAAHPLVRLSQTKCPTHHKSTRLSKIR